MSATASKNLIRCYVVTLTGAGIPGVSQTLTFEDRPDDRELARGQILVVDQWVSFLGPMTPVRHNLTRWHLRKLPRLGFARRD